MVPDSMDADLKRPDEVTNLFNFDKCQSTASRASESTWCTKYLEMVQYESGLHHSKQLSSLSKTDTYGTISMVDSTGNAPKSTSTQSVRYFFADDVYTNLEQISAKEAIDINSSIISQTAHTSDYHGGRLHFLSEIKNSAEGFVGFRFNNNYD
jgi:hypothetical protein